MATFKPGMKVFWNGNDGCSDIPAQIARVFKSTVTLTVSIDGEIQTIKGVPFSEIEPAWINKQKQEKPLPAEDLPESKPVTEWKKFEEIKDDIFADNFSPQPLVQLVKLADIYPKDKEESDFNSKATLLQPRFRLNNDSVERYVNRLEISEAPPVLLMLIEDKYVLIDGYHRREAYYKAGRKEIPAIIETGDFDTAFYKAVSANLNHALPLDKREIEKACKNFINKIANFSQETIDRILDDLSVKTGKKYSMYKGQQITDTVVGDIFGYSSRHIKNLRDEIEREKILSKFAKGDRVLMQKSAHEKINNALKILPEQEQLGIIERIDNDVIWVAPFNDRLIDLSRGSIAFGSDEIIVSDLDYEEPNYPLFSLGDRVRHWLGEWGCGGTVVSLQEKNFIWSSKPISPEHPLIFLDNGQHIDVDFYLLESLGGNVAVPSPQERIEALKKQIGKIEGEGALADYLHGKYDAQIESLKTKDTVHKMRKQIFPDVEKYAEDPQNCEVALLEPPPKMPKSVENQQLKVARNSQLKDQVLDAIATIKNYGAEVLDDDEIEDLLKFLFSIQTK